MDIEKLMKRSYIAAPCEVAWEDMQGDDKQRFCGQCKLSVLNAAAMSDEEVAQALTRAQNGERVCMQLYKRQDGTILTKNCPVGLKRIRESARRAAAWLAGALSMLVSTAVSAAPATKGDTNSKSNSKPTWHSTIKGDCQSPQTTAAPSAGATNTGIKAHDYPIRGKVAVIPSNEEVTMQQQELARIRKTQGFADSIQLADALVRLSSTYQRRHEPAQALPLRLQALKIYEGKQQWQSASYCCSALAYIYSALQDEKNAALYRQREQEYTAKLKSK